MYAVDKILAAAAELGIDTGGPLRPLSLKEIAEAVHARLKEISGRQTAQIAALDQEHAWLRDEVARARAQLAEGN